MLVSFYNYQPLPQSLGPATVAHWDNYMPEGTILAIKEPFVKPIALWV